MTPDPTTANAFRTLALKVQSERGACKFTDGLAWKLVVAKEGDHWTDQLCEDGIWYRRDEEDQCAYDTAPALTSCLSDVVKFVATHAPDFDWTLDSTGTATLASRVKGDAVTIGSAPGQPERALLAAFLLLRARQANGAVKVTG